LKKLDLETTFTSGITLATGVYFYTEIKPTKKLNQLPAILLKPAQFNPVKPVLDDLLATNGLRRTLHRSRFNANNDPEIDPEMLLSFILPDPVVDAIVGSCN
jgi:hypothetical protein